MQAGRGQLRGGVAALTFLFFFYFLFNFMKQFRRFWDLLPLLLLLRLLCGFQLFLLVLPEAPQNFLDVMGFSITDNMKVTVVPNCLQPHM